MVSFVDLANLYYGSPKKEDSMLKEINTPAVPNGSKAPAALESARTHSLRDYGPGKHEDSFSRLTKGGQDLYHPAKRQKLSTQHSAPTTTFKPAHKARPPLDTSLKLYEVAHGVTTIIRPSPSGKTSQNNASAKTIESKTPGSSGSPILIDDSQRKEKVHLPENIYAGQPNTLAVASNNINRAPQAPSFTSSKQERLSLPDFRHSRNPAGIHTKQRADLSRNVRRTSTIARGSSTKSIKKSTDPVGAKRNRIRSISEPSVQIIAASIGRIHGSSRLPYKSERPKIRREDNFGTIKHAGFSDLEREIIIVAVEELQGPLSRKLPLVTVGHRLSRKLRGLTGKDIDAIVCLAQSKPELVSTRKRRAIRTYLFEAMKEAPEMACLTRVEEVVVQPNADPNISSLLRHRELGFQRMGRCTQQDLQFAVIDKLAYVGSWKGASGDVVASAWSPDSQNYAVGATAPANAEDLQYNRSNNFLYGDIDNSTLRELPDHRQPRPKPETFASGPNASAAVYDALDPIVYRTVTAIQFSPDGGQLYSASHDSTVKIWDVKQSVPICTDTLEHSAHVTALETSRRLFRTFATASHKLERSIRVYAQRDDFTWGCTKLESERALQRPQYEIYPECLRWGLAQSTEHLLLAGFTRWGDLPDHNPAREGDLCLWDVATGQKLKILPCAQNVYTAAFHPFLDAFSTGSSPGSTLTHQWTTRSVVRTWDRRSKSPHATFEYECPALDMQDLVFHPRDANVLAVGCTDGTIYVWDARVPSHPLHHFEHGEPIADWEHRYDDEPMTREQGDCGVNMTLWGAGQNRLYTGATDGAIKCWDIRRSPEDAFVKDIAQLQAGVSCGSFSPDYVSLLVGDSTGGVHLLSSNSGGAQQDSNESGPQPIKHLPTEREELPLPSIEDLMPGQLAAQELLDTQQLVMDPEFSIGQGPAYAGPYAAYAHEPGEPGTAKLLHDFEKQQPVSKHGRVRDNNATRNIKGTIARRRQELGNVEATDMTELTIDMEDVALQKKISWGSVKMVAADEDELEDDHWFPRMDEEVFAKLEEKYPKANNA